MAEGEIEPEGPWWPGQALPAAWSAHSAALEAWQQGDVVLDVPITWIMPLGIDPVSGAENVDDYVTAFGGPDAPTVHLVLCSQSCDIGVEGTGGSHPFVLGAPLVPGSSMSDAERKLACDYRMGYLLPASPDPASVAPKSGGWFVDLRLMVPVSKGLLLTRTPVRGFVGSGSPSAGGSDSVVNEELIRFAESVAFKFRRPALNSVLSEDLPRLIDAHIAKFPGAQAFRSTRQVRLHVENGTHLEPTTIRIYVLYVVPLSVDEENLWRGWEKKGAEMLRKAGIALSPTVFISPSNFSLEEGWKTSPVILKKINSSAGW